MCFAYLSPILGAGRPPAYLTFTCIKVAKVIYQISVTTNRLQHKVTALFLGNTGRFVVKKTGNGLLVTGLRKAPWHP